MRITHVSSVDIRGGAARSTYRLHQALLREGIDSTLYVLRKESDDPTVVQFNPPNGVLMWALRAQHRLFLRRTGFQRSGLRPWNASYFSDDRAEHRSHILAQLPSCDVLHLHWVAGFVDYSYFFPRLPEDRPVVWTLHDMNPFTGGCHFDGGCGRFTLCCGSCPQLTDSNATDFSYKCWTRKNFAYQSLKPEKLHVVAPSQWLAQEVRRSSLFSSRPVTVIPNGLDTDVFQPRDSRAARDVLGLGGGAKVILFLADWASEARKGLPQLVEALSSIPDHSKLCLILLGRGPAELPETLPRIRLEYVNSDRLLSVIYSAADVFVLPALQDNLPNTILEALACGLPVVAFSTGGIADLVQDGVEGRLVPCGNTTALRDALLYVLNNEDARRSMSAKARSKAVKEYALEIQARRYVELYRSLGAVRC